MSLSVILPALIGGVLIGVSATLLLWLNGRIAGISGVINGVITPSNGFWGADVRWRWLFLGGLLVGGAIYEWGLASSPTPVPSFAPLAMILGGLLVGYGARMGNGCTSGHGVCGLGRLSLRSLASVVTFLATGIITVYVMRNLLG